MNRRATLALAAGLIGLAGCQHFLFSESPLFPAGDVDWSRLGAKVNTPDPAKVSARLDLRGDGVVPAVQLEPGRCGEPPVTGDEADKLSPDAVPSKSAHRP